MLNNHFRYLRCQGLKYVWLFCLLILSLQSQAGVWVTWYPVEPDTCASAWLIKRLVDRQAEFKFLPKGTPVEQGTAFDTPLAEFRRYHNLSTYGSIVRKYRIQDLAVLEIKKLIYDMEINKWDNKIHPDSVHTEITIRDNIQAADSPAEGCKLNFNLLDKLYQKYQTTLDR